MARIDVTKTFLPPLDEYMQYVEQIWASGWLTNHGPLLQEFEEAIKQYLGVTHFHSVTNGTLALQLALRALDLPHGSEIITTPFSYVATTSAILWERYKPVYVDIDAENFCIDADKIEAAITKKTKAIVAVHVFGLPCNVEKIEALAKKHKLHVIYDGAHAFGVSYKGTSLLNYGDLSICSFHATKLFHTIEGGGVIAKNKRLANRVELMKHFGHHGDEHFALGINAKASEFQAAMGLCNLKYVDENIKKRKAIVAQYDQLLHSKLRRPHVSDDVQRNYAYYPVVFESEAQLLQAMERLKAADIFPRRYFYPSLNTLPYVQAKACPISEDIAARIACLPLFVGLSEDAVAKIVRTLHEV
ncbi:MAG TPA: DegT/DnrJ/EryC1/StrS family aminotransferase [Candidatus Saccharimonadales bacterium]|nr:DegT/DnrJ/EryC1/StrS family aminotransferase [Candidatus Saccharimonadales bacterium]